MVGTDPTLVAIVVPIVALFSLAFWLGVVFYAGSHPFWRHHQQQVSARPTGTLPPSAVQGLPGSAGATAGGAAGPQRIAHG